MSEHTALINGSQLWEATISARQPDGDREKQAVRSIGDQRVEIRVGATDYLATLRLHATGLADATRQTLGLWSHAVEKHNLPRWPAAALILHQCHERQDAPDRAPARP